MQKMQICRTEYIFFVDKVYAFEDKFLIKSTLDDKLQVVSAWHTMT